ncbi:MAG TPA: AbrB/MazE/SpoVT family DNA-binding domain-containing protein [Thermodesulfobacteriota bacterium]|nr:AbrB/MazE/SpoVT family DNA-binding domain-containing protein [Thermodesulfobacteriota bacterium]
MKSTVGERGQVVIPKEIRDRLGLEKGTILEVETAGEDNLIVLRPLKKRKRHWREWIGTFKGKGLIREYLADKKKERERDKKWKK